MRLEATFSLNDDCCSDHIFDTADCLSLTFSSPFRWSCSSSFYFLQFPELFASSFLKRFASTLVDFQMACELLQHYSDILYFNLICQNPSSALLSNPWNRISNRFNYHLLQLCRIRARQKFFHVSDNPALYGFRLMLSSFFPVYHTTTMRTQALENHLQKKSSCCERMALWFVQNSAKSQNRFCKVTDKHCPHPPEASLRWCTM